MRVRQDEFGRIERKPGVFHANCPKPDPRASLPPRRERTGVLLDPYRIGMTPEYVAGVAPKEDEKRRTDRLAALSASTEPLDRLAAHRMRISANRAEGVKREAVSSHPRGWPAGSCDDVGESYSTHGSSGR